MLAAKLDALAEDMREIKGDVKALGKESAAQAVHVAQDYVTTETCATRQAVTRQDLAALEGRMNSRMDRMEAAFRWLFGLAAATALGMLTDLVRVLLAGKG